MVQNVLIQNFNVADNITVDYGFSMLTIAYVDHLYNVSPFLRATFDGGEYGRVRAGFSSGATPTELLARDEAKEGTLDQDFVALAALPRYLLPHSSLCLSPYFPLRRRARSPRKRASDSSLRASKPVRPARFHSAPRTTW